MASNALVEKSALVFIGLVQSQRGPVNGKSRPYRWQNARNELATCDRESQVNDHGTSSAKKKVQVSLACLPAIEIERRVLPLGRFTHAPDDLVQCFHSTLLQRFGNGLGTLFVGREFK